MIRLFIAAALLTIVSGHASAGTTDCVKHDYYDKETPTDNTTFYGRFTNRCGYTVNVMWTHNYGLAYEGDSCNHGYLRSGYAKAAIIAPGGSEEHNHVVPGGCSARIRYCAEPDNYELRKKHGRCRR